MSNELLIEVGAYETRVALLEDGKLVEVHLERSSDAGVVGDIYKGRVSRVVRGIQAAFIDIGLSRDAFLFAGDIRREGRPITDEVKQGQELLVQVVKEPLPGKGARISSQITLPGRFVVLLPNESGVGISRRIADTQERERLESEIEPVLPESCGVIVRTAGENRPVADLHREILQLEGAWKDLKARASGLKAPAVARREMSLAMRTMRDFSGEDVSRIWIDGDEAYGEVMRYLEDVDPPLAERIEHHTGEEPLFGRFGVDAALARAMRTRVWLSSGGFIVIDPTEALVSIDVNSGRNTEGVELEETARTTNLEAAEEIARQVRLRDLSGIIVVDFIDMLEEGNRQELVEAFGAALARDRTRTQISQMSDFGLVAITRKRMRGGLLQRLTEPCPCCAGDGWIKNPVTVGLEVGRELSRRDDVHTEGRVVVELHPRVKGALEDDRDGLLGALREQAGGELELEENTDLQLGEYVIRNE